MTCVTGNLIYSGVSVVTRCFTELRPVGNYCCSRDNVTSMLVKVEPPVGGERQGVGGGGGAIRRKRGGAGGERLGTGGGDGARSHSPASGQPAAATLLVCSNSWSPNFGLKRGFTGRVPLVC